MLLLGLSTADMSWSWLILHSRLFLYIHWLRVVTVLIVISCAFLFIITIDFSSLTRMDKCPALCKIFSALYFSRRYRHFIYVTRRSLAILWVALIDCSWSPDMSQYFARKYRDIMFDILKVAGFIELASLVTVSSMFRRHYYFLPNNSFITAHFVFTTVPAITEIVRRAHFRQARSPSLMWGRYCWELRWVDVGQILSMLFSINTACVSSLRDAATFRSWFWLAEYVIRLVNTRMSSNRLMGLHDFLTLLFDLMDKIFWWMSANSAWHYSTIRPHRYRGWQWYFLSFRTSPQSSRRSGFNKISISLFLVSALDYYQPLYWHWHCVSLHLSTRSIVMPASLHTPPTSPAGRWGDFLKHEFLTKVRSRISASPILSLLHATLENMLFI